MNNLSIMPQEIYRLPEILTADTAAEVYRSVIERIRRLRVGDTLSIDFGDVRTIDSAGVVTVETLHKKCIARNVAAENINLSDSVAKTYALFSQQIQKPEAPPRSPKYQEIIGSYTYWIWTEVRDFTILLSNVYFWGVVALFKRGLMRKGEVIRQSNFIGVNALPIVSVVAFLIGFILALQSANQLRPFGADIFVAQLVAIAMVGEMGPLITAIMVAGRSGSSFTAEIGAMVVSEEIDALKSMGIDPVPYLVVPKLFAIVLTMPMLTMLANFIGIFGGAVIGMTYMQLELIPFYNEVISVLRYKEILTSVIKSVIFAVLILVTGVYYGLHVEGGPEGVGRATTRSVVVSVLLVIIADSILGLLFYFD
jgi:phospholipid/cholesterol/gamma-HCH transport system permease protein